MATVAVDVSQYKRIYRVAERAIVAVLGEDELMTDHFPDLPYPDWVCDHCGYDNDSDFEWKRCPRCNKAQ